LKQKKDKNKILLLDKLKKKNSNNLFIKTYIIYRVGVTKFWKFKSIQIMQIIFIVGI